MGIEYKLRFVAPDSAVVDDLVRHVPGARELAPPRSGVEFVTADASWPQASVQVKQGGVYFCDHCGSSGRAVLGEVIARLVSNFGSVTVEEV
jgi:hypothetical protein